MGAYALSGAVPICREPPESATLPTACAATRFPPTTDRPGQDGLPSQSAGPTHANTSALMAFYA